MANLYIWFPNNEERRQFVLDLLEIEEIKPNGGSKKAKKEAERKRAQLELYMESLEAGKTKSPYYQLHKHFYMGITPDIKTEPAPWTELAVFKKGFRRIYTQKSYWFRPGHWLVLQFRDNYAGRERRRWAEERIPEERQGVNVPIPPEVLAKMKLEHVTQLLSPVTIADSGGVGAAALKVSLQLLNEVKQSHPQLFKGENVYLWEQLGFAFYHAGNIEKADYCLRTQAGFQHGVSDAFLNLGTFYDEQGMWELAAKAYIDGLAVNPEDEFIHYNLASLYMDKDKQVSVLQAINSAVLKNPYSAVNYKLKGDIHLYNGQYHAAVTAYLQAVDLMYSRQNSMTAETYCNLASAYTALGKHNEALASLEEAVIIDNKNIDALLKLAELYGDKFENWDKAKTYAEQALAVYPDCSEACRVMAKYHQTHGSSTTAKWFAKRAKKAAGR